MEDLPDEDKIDLEALQAQIDLSLAHTKNLVSSWLQPTFGSHPVSSRHKEDKEIQDLLRRPSRLGVGAPIPASAGSLGHETLKLKHKLTGKKRSREDDRMDALTTERSEDEAESRTGAIQKKPRVDPFASKGGKAKRQSDLSKGLETTIPPGQMRKGGSESRNHSSTNGRTQVDHSPVPSGEIAEPSMSISQIPQRQLSSTASENSEAAPVASHDQKLGLHTSLKSPTKTPHTHPENPGTGTAVLNLDGPPAPPDNPLPRKRRKKKKRKRKIGQSSDGVTQ